MTTQSAAKAKQIARDARAAGAAIDPATCESESQRGAPGLRADARPAESLEASERGEASEIFEADSQSLDEARSLAAAIEERVSLQPADPAWARAFELERDHLRAVAPGVFVQIEHIGSTAVPGLVAKPIVDILAGVASLEGVDGLVDRLCQHGYATSREFNATLADRRWLMRWKNGHRTHHLHIVEHGGTPWNERLAFRDALRLDAALAERYASLKTDLASRHHDDREAYTQAKADFVRSVVERPLRR